MTIDELIHRYSKLKTKWIRQVKSAKTTETELEETQYQMLLLAEKMRDHESGLSPLKKSNKAS